MRASGTTIIALTALGLSACSDGFDPTYELSCPTDPIRVGAAASISMAYTSFDPIGFEWVVDPITRGTFADALSPADPTNEAEPVMVGTQYDPVEAGTTKVSALVDGVEVASCSFEVLPVDTPPVTLTVVVTGMGTVTSVPGDIDCPGTCAADVLPGTQVTLTTAAATDWELTDVTGDCTGTGTNYSVTPTANATCNFTFVDVSTPPIDQVQIPSGTFTRGCTDAANCPAFETPAATVTLSAGYGINKYETTVAEYRVCVMAGECQEPEPYDPADTFPCNWGAPGRDDHPVNCVNYGQARAYCQWLDMDLPTEAQWERAARGDDDARDYPWGDETPDCTRGAGTVLDPFMRCTRAGTSSVAQHAAGASPYGVEDMAGNVEEWVLDWYQADYYMEASSQVNPMGPAMGMRRLARGGSYRGFRTVFDRGYQLLPESSNSDLGFRCASTE